MGSGNPNLNNITANPQLVPCRREPCHLDSQGANVFKVDGTSFGQLKADNTYVTGGGIEYPIKIASSCSNTIQNNDSGASICTDVEEHKQCSKQALLDFAAFMDSEYSKSQQDSCLDDKDHHQEVLINTLMSVEIADRMYFDNMTFVESVGAWNQTFIGSNNDLVLSFSSTKAELIYTEDFQFNSTNFDIIKAKYKDIDQCKESGFAFILNEDCIKAIIENLKENSLRFGLSYHNIPNNLIVVASAGVRNHMIQFLNGSVDILSDFQKIFTDFDNITQSSVEIVSGEKEAQLGMDQMAAENITYSEAKAYGYLDFGGSSIQPSFWLKDGSMNIYPTNNGECHTQSGVVPCQLNSFLNYGSQAVQRRLSLLYQKYPHYNNVCHIGVERFNLESCRKLIKYIGSGADLAHEDQDNFTGKSLRA